MILSTKNLAATVGVKPACDGLRVSRATFYRCKGRHLRVVPKPGAPSPLALKTSEREEVVSLLDSPRFLDRSPAAVYATLLDEGKYICSIRTMNRILAARGEVRERRDHVQRPSYAKPELLAVAPNQLWSWDITKLHGPAKWSYFYLYVILDVYSRYVVGWMVAHAEQKSLAVALIQDTCFDEL